MCLDICVHPGNYHHNQENELICHPKNFPHASLRSYPCSQIITNFLFATEGEFVFTECVITQYVLLFVLPISLSKITLKFLHVVSSITSSVLVLSSIALYGYTTVNQLTY